MFKIIIVKYLLIIVSVSQWMLSNQLLVSVETPKNMMSLQNLKIGSYCGDSLDLFRLNYLLEIFYYHTTTNLSHAAKQGQSEERAPRALMKARTMVCFD
jgi:hypothetical protein